MGTNRTTAKDRLRERLLDDLATYAMQMMQAGAWTGSKPCAIERCRAVAGPRAGAVELLAGMDMGKIRQHLTTNDSAVLRRAIPWCTGDPQCYFRGPFLRIEGGWPDGLECSMIRLDDISRKPTRADCWTAGMSETGGTVVANLSDRTPHFLIAGSTGAGKSVALQNAIVQLSAYAENRLVLVDGKFGESLKALERLPGVVGPCAVEHNQAHAALAWAVGQMRDRYRQKQDGRIIVVLDEFQELVADSAIVTMMRQLAAQGRGAHVHLLASTQHPTIEAFGDASTRRNLTGKVALRVADPDASRVAVGGKSPRADKLLGGGDSFVVGPGRCERVQGAFVDDGDVARVMEKANGRAGAWMVESWPDPVDLDTSQIPGDNSTHTKESQWTAIELACALASALAGEGRPAMEARSKALGVDVGSTRGRRLIKIGRDLLSVLQANGYSLTAPTAVVPVAGWLVE